MARVVVIDGLDFHTLEGFYEAIGNALIPGQNWGKNLDAFNSILCWPLNDDPEPYVLIWRHSKVSRKRLNHLEAERHLEIRLEHCHPLNRSVVKQEMETASRCEGPTVFDWLVEIIRSHPEWLTLKLE